jgi:hypothetical protein
MIFPKFHDVYKKDCEKKTPCCAYNIIWYNCYRVGLNQIGDPQKGKNLEVKIPPVGGDIQPGWRALRVAVLGYEWCSCESGTWRCHPYQVGMNSSNGLSYKLDQTNNLKSSKWVPSPPQN